MYPSLSEIDSGLLLVFNLDGTRSKTELEGRIGTAFIYCLGHFTDLVKCAKNFIMTKMTVSFIQI